MTRVLGFSILVLLAVSAPTLLSAQPGVGRGRDRDRADTEAEAARHADATASTADAMAALANAVEIEEARRLAPFDLDWGTP